MVNNKTDPAMFARIWRIALDMDTPQPSNPLQILEHTDMDLRYTSQLV